MLFLGAENRLVSLFFLIFFIRHSFIGRFWVIERFWNWNSIRLSDQTQSDNAVNYATDVTDDRSGKMAQSLPESGVQPQPCAPRLSDCVKRTKDSFDTAAKDYKDRQTLGFTFPEALEKYKETLKKITDQIIPIYARTKDTDPSPLLEKEEAQELRQQFNHIRRNLPDIRKQHNGKT